MKSNEKDIERIDIELVWVDWILNKLSKKQVGSCFVMWGFIYCFNSLFFI